MKEYQLIVYYPRNLLGERQEEIIAKSNNINELLVKIDKYEQHQKDKKWNEKNHYLIEEIENDQ